MDEKKAEAAIKAMWDDYLYPLLLDLAEKGKLTGAHHYEEQHHWFKVRAYIPEELRLLSERVDELRARWLEEARAAAKEASDA